MRLTALAAAALFAPAALAQVTVSNNAEMNSFQMLQGAQIRIQFNVSDSSGNQVAGSLLNYAVINPRGYSGAITPLTCTSNCPALLTVSAPLVQGHCTTAANGVPTSTVGFDIQATSVTTPSSSATLHINVCADTTRAWILGAPYRQLYEGQPLNLLSSVSGAVDQSVQWALVSQPSGASVSLGDTNKASLAWPGATTPGDYTVKVTSLHDTTTSASIKLHVVPHPSPYTAKPNHADIFPCEVDSGLGVPSITIGAGKQYATPDLVPQNAAASGAFIQLFNTDSTGSSPTNYNRYMQIQQTSATKMTVLCGVPDSGGNLPVINGNNSSGASWTSTTTAGGISLLDLANGNNNKTFLQFDLFNILVSGIKFIHYRTGVNYYDASGNQQTIPGGTGGSECIRINQGVNITIAGNDIEDCAVGVQSQGNTNDQGPGTLPTSVLIESNYYQDDGSVNDTDHSNYLQGHLVAAQFNYIGTPQNGNVAGYAIKQRGQGSKFLYNYFAAGYARQGVDYVEPEDTSNIIDWNNFSANGGDSSFMTSDQVAGLNEDESHDVFMGNIVNAAPGVYQTTMHYASDKYGWSIMRQGQLLSLNNTYLNVWQLFVTPNGGADSPSTEYRYPLFYSNNDLITASSNFALNYTDSFIAQFVTSAVYPGASVIDYTVPNQGLRYNGGAKGLANQPTVGDAWAQPITNHITGYDTTNIRPLSSMPISTTTFAPVSGSPIINAGTAPTGEAALNPVRFQYVPASYTFVARSSPLTLGAVDNGVPGKTPVSITLSPVGVVVSINSAVQFKCTETYSDGTTADCTSRATWTTSSGSITAGLFSSPSVLSTVTISAAVDGLNASQTVTIVSLVPRLLGNTQLFGSASIQ